jgi:hypothetical protein
VSMRIIDIGCSRPHPKDEQCVIPVDSRSSYNPSFTPPVQAGQKGLTFSRDASSLFGFKAFAVHMTGEANFER